MNKNLTENTCKTLVSSITINIYIYKKKLSSFSCIGQQFHAKGGRKFVKNLVEWMVNVLSDFPQK